VASVLRVLYVDDDRVNSLLFAELCRLDPRIEVITAGSAAEAIELASPAAAADASEAAGTSGRLDLLVLDLHLPDGDGLSLLPRLHEATGRALPAYLCSADDPAQLASAARSAGFIGCWSKPLDIPRVLDALKEHAGR
jgi:two-component system, OmpR family, response regulator